jgi:hypothetical protein
MNLSDLHCPAAMVVLTLVCLLLSLAVLARLVRWRPDEARAPLVIIGLLIVALAVVAYVVWQVSLDRPTTPTVDPITIMNKVDPERQAREKDIAALDTRLDQLKADLSKLDQ